MKEIYRKIKDSKDVDNLKLATIIDGPKAGGKILLCREQILYADPDANILIDNIEYIQEINNTGMVKLGNVSVFVEAFSSVPQLVICGAGTVGQALVKIAATLDIEVTVIDDREEFLTQASKKGADRCICKAFEDGLKTVDYDNPTYYVVVTREHHFDQTCLREILKKPYVYLGVMGSKKRIGLLKDRLIEEGFDREQVESIHAPIGLPIGGDTPEEIAVSILAEIIQIKNTVRKSEGYRGELLNTLLDANEDCAIATIVDKCGSTPRSTGTKMVVRHDGTITGTVGGGVIEAAVIKKALDLLKSDNKTVLYQTEMTKGESALCGGSQLIFIERINFSGEN